LDRATPARFLSGRDKHTPLVRFNPPLHRAFYIALRAPTGYANFVRSIFQTIRVIFLLAVAAAAATAAESPSQAVLLSPPQTEGPVVVRVGFQLLEINSIDEQSESFEFSGVLTVQWVDERQAFDPATEGIGEKYYQGHFQFNEISPSWYPEISLLNVAGMFDKGEPLFRIRADGTCTLVAAVNASARTPLNLRLYPFDRHALRIVFGIPGYTNSELLIEPLPLPGPAPGKIHLPQMKLLGTSTTAASILPTNPGSNQPTSTLVVELDVKRNPLFVLRLVVGPLFLVVILSWSVFWMDRASVGDRMSVSFVGLLTAVAYQIILGDILPHIAYLTPVNVFVNLSFIVMCASIVVNLIVGELNRSGRGTMADTLDNRCKVIFPIVYLSLIIFTAVVFTVRFRS